MIKVSQERGICEFGDVEAEYAKVSMPDQILDLQTDALKKDSCEKVLAITFAS